ncbi:S9 family peptidase [Sinomicrobium pectinilyticum]|uniref:S9 family peptidase n=1 Tax=Sinomicrobium pectinilyticum TaxID=1084421 RepID=A0A3N0EGQ2_SINP1|nr:S9 family peptidase [Sinomicrobium pectinilyticum]RNL87063.1 S9 family peptidase [Sinomicrobium pectinilyticum]
MKVNPLLLLLLCCNALFAQISGKLELKDIFDLEYISGPAISPDGKKIVYVRHFSDIMTDKNLSNLWIMNADGSNNRPLTTGNHNDTQPVWSHNSEMVVYKSDKDGKVQLYLHWPDNGNEIKLTNSVTTPGSVSFSRDDSYLAFSMFIPSRKKQPAIQLPEKPEGATWNDPPRYIDDLKYRADGSGYLKEGYSHIFTLPVTGGTPRQLTSGDLNYGSPVWDKDGKHLLFAANLHNDREYEPNNSEIYRISVSTGTMDTLTTRKGPDRNPVVSPDGKTIAYLGHDERYMGYQITRLYLMNSDGSSPELISGNFDRDVRNIYWAKDGKSLYFQYDEKGDTKIGSIDLNGKVKTLVEGAGGLTLGRPYNAADFSVSSNGTIAYTLGGTQHPADLAVLNGKSSSRLTDVNKDIFDYKKTGKVEEIWYKSSFDGKDIQGWIVTPPGFDPGKKYPLILEIHGGPFTSYGSVFSAEIQMYAARGYVVLYTNPRGSTGYGEEFGNLIHHDYPNHDYDDLMSGVDEVIKKGYIDTENLFVTGGSGGGVLTAWIVGHTDRFAAAVVAKPVINWYSFVLYADNPAYFAKYWFGEFPWDNPEPYLKRSPLSYVGNVTTPTMLLTGESDFRTPIPESEQFYTALKLRKVDAAMVRIPGASHGITSRPSNLIGKVAAVLSWFDKHKQ